MQRRPPGTTVDGTRIPYTTLFRSDSIASRAAYGSDGSSAKGSGGRPGGRSSRTDLAYAAPLLSRHRFTPRAARTYRTPDPPRGVAASADVSADRMAS